MTPEGLTLLDDPHHGEDPDEKLVGALRGVNQSCGALLALLPEVEDHGLDFRGIRSG